MPVKLVLTLFTLNPHLLNLLAYLVSWVPSGPPTDPPIVQLAQLPLLAGSKGPPLSL